MSYTFRFYRSAYGWGILSLVLSLLLLTACGGGRVVNDNGLSFRQYLQAAEQAKSNGNFLAAANNYAAAFTQKPSRQEVGYEAAELYTRVRAYEKATTIYARLSPDERRWPLLGLQYGRALKQHEQYEDARRQLTQFRDSYNGADRAIVTEIVANELAGIRLAQTSDPGAETVVLSRPGRGVNTGSEEYGPVAINGDQLFFSSTQGGQSRLYQSRFQARAWTKATVPPGFPVIAEGTFGTGAFHPDGQTFFFTICSGQTKKDATNRCEIFRGRRSASGAWSQPVALGAKVNVPGSNNAYPGVAVAADGRTLLYFASDRPGGRGGLDLYLSIQQNTDDTRSFSDPVNLGSTINTVSDEITPLYSPNEGYLYFASDGHPSYGGYDIFRAAGALTDFSPPENLSTPVNSAADDYGLSLVENSGRAFMTSNRRYAEKTTTVDADIFTLNFQAGKARLSAKIYDNTTGSELGGATVTVYEQLPEGGEQQLGQRQFPTGLYDFDLRPARRYRVTVEREGYRSATYRVETSLSGSSLYGQPVFLRRDLSGNGNSTPPPTQPRTTPTPTAPPVIIPAPAPAPSVPATTETKRVAPIAYRIQISAVRDFDANASKYDRIRSVGNLQSEAIPGKRIRRITIGYFTDKASAKAALRNVQRNGFSDAFVVRYDAGKRHGIVQL